MSPSSSHGTIRQCLIIAVALVLSLSPSPKIFAKTTATSKTAHTSLRISQICQLPIIIADDAHPQDLHTALALQKNLSTISANTHLIRTRSQHRGPAIYLQQNNAPSSLPVDQWNQFTIDIRRHSIHIHATDAPALQLASNYFAQKVIGLQRYWPGELGYQMIKNPRQKLRRRKIAITAPHYSTQLSGIPGHWQQHNLLHPRIDFHHGLNKIFTNEVFAEHPEFLPTLDTSIEGLDARHFQPDLGKKEVAQYAANWIIDYFDQNPQATSIRLGINDNVSFGHSPETLALTQPTSYFRDRPDYSNLLATFMNRVAQGIAHKYPHKYLGCLAYYWMENVPTIPLHPQVVPYVTSDRAQGYDPQWKTKDQDLTQRWRHSGAHITAHYDYWYGSPYPFPRMPLTLMTESIAYAYQQGNRAHYAEISPIWPLDGPKPWVLAQLLWQPTAQPQTLIDHFYQHFFQEAAAPMRAFYQQAESQWMSQNTSGKWIRLFTDEANIELFPPQLCQKMQQLLEEAHALAQQNPRVQQRVQAVINTFALTQHYSLAHQARKNLITQNYHSEQDIVQAMQQLQTWLHHNQSYWQKAESLKQQSPLYKNLHRVLYQQKRWQASQPERHALARILLYLHEHPNHQLEYQLFTLLQPHLELLDLALTFHIKNKSKFNRLKNPSFEAPLPYQSQVTAEKIIEPLPWHPSYYKNQSFRYSRDPQTAQDGQAAITLHHKTTGRLYQSFGISRHKFFHLQCWAKGTILPGASHQLRLTFLDENKDVVEIAAITLPQGEYKQWQNYHLLAQAPPRAIYGLVELNSNRQDEQGILHLDNFSLQSYRR